MKIIVPVEIRIQDAAEVHQDPELQKCANEVAEMRAENRAVRRENMKIAFLCFAVLLVFAMIEGARLFKWLT